MADPITTGLNAATNAVQTLSNTVTSLGSASGLGSIQSSITNLFGSVNKFFKDVKTLNFPQSNPLFKYASYTYVLGIGCLSDDDVNYPDKSYRAGRKIPLLAKDANADPNNRVNTPYGKFDFFINNLQLESVIGFEQGQNTNVTNITFDIIEPYSMGMFMIACEQLALQQGHANWLEAPFILTIDFKGATETGTMASVPNSSRQIPFTFIDVKMTADENGAKYQCECVPFNQQALSDVNHGLKTDVAIKGKTVQEILQTGEKSLQAAVNSFYKEQAKKNNIPVPDEMCILFPNDVASSATPAASSDNSENTDGATTSTDSASATAIFEKLGVSRSAINSTLIQNPDDCNAIGQSDLGFSETRKADSSVGQDNKVYDPNLKINVRSSNTVDAKQTDMKFTQDSNISNAINQVILSSKFLDTTFDPSNLSPEGYRDWWRIDVQVYNISTDENLAVTGSKPKLYVYRVVPYMAHASKMMPPNTKAPGFTNMHTQVVKEYNYIYTGKNVDVLRFDIKMNLDFIGTMAPDGLTRSQDSVTAAQTGGALGAVPQVNPLGQGNPPEKGAWPTMVKFIKTLTGTDKKGGGGVETQTTRAGRLFYDALTSGVDMIELSMDIIGDPYWIAQSGTGNYTSTQVSQQMNTDGSVNYQNGEVVARVNFRTPIDINQTTGLYNFGGSSASAPIIKYSGLYQIYTVKSIFKDGTFQQTLDGIRYPGQELSKEATPEKTFSTAKTIINALDPYGYGDG
jgi:hypothetical protein